MRLSIAHTTTYAYEKPVRTALQQVRLTPVSSPTQAVETWNVNVDGGLAELCYDDEHGNKVHLVRATAGTSALTITSAGVVETFGQGAAIADHASLTPLWLYRRHTSLTEAGPALRELTSQFDASASHDIAAVHALSAAVRAAINYEVGSTSTFVTAEDALVAGAGVCQDHAHVFIAAVRSLGLPARYVSGYLMMNDRVDQDATHAWAEAWIDQLGWVGFDVSNAISPDERYVTLATGLDYADAAPVVGVRTGTGAEQLQVEVQVQQ